MKQIALNPNKAEPNDGHHSVKNGLTRLGSSVSLLIAHSAPISEDEKIRQEKKIKMRKLSASFEMRKRKI